MIRRRSFLAGAAAATLLPGAAWAAPSVERGVDPVFEWLAALARAAGFDEYLGGVDAWAQALAPALAKVAHHRAVAMLKHARSTRGLAYDAMASMAAHLGGEPGALIARVPFDPFPASLDERWRGTASDTFVAAASDAARLAGFSEILRAQSGLVAQAEEALAGETAAFDLAWYEAFFGVPLPGRLRVAVSLGSGPNNYGAHVVVDGRRETYAVLCAGVDREGAFAVSGLPTLVHEVGHDFVNPLVDAHLDAFAEVGKRLYGLVEAQMRANAYGAWDNVLHESVLRACVVRYLAAHGGDVAGELEINRRQGYRWIGPLAEALAPYEADRTRWPTFDSFLPELVPAVGAAADAEAARAAKVPHVVSISPANGARNVDPATAALVVTFDRPMVAGNWAVCGGGPKYPQMDHARYDEARRTFTIDLKLEPGHDYELWLNTDRYTAFRAEGGEPLEPVHVRFRTRR